MLYGHRYCLSMCGNLIYILCDFDVYMLAIHKTYRCYRYMCCMSNTQLPSRPEDIDLFSQNSLFLFTSSQRMIPLLFQNLPCQLTESIQCAITCTALLCHLLQQHTVCVSIILLCPHQAQWHVFPFSGEVLSVPPSRE